MPQPSVRCFIYFRVPRRAPSGCALLSTKRDIAPRAFTVTAGRLSPPPSKRCESGVLTTIKNQGDEIDELHKEVEKLQAKLEKEKTAEAKVKAAAAKAKTPAATKKTAEKKPAAKKATTTKKETAK